MPPSRRPAADRFAVLRAGLSGAHGWCDPATRARARAAVRAVAGDAAGDALAVAHLAHHAAREMLLDRPRLLAGAPVLGTEVLSPRRIGGRPVVVSHCHFGPFPAMAVSLAPFLPRINAVGGAWIADPPPGIPQPVRRHRWRAIFDTAGVPLVSSENGGGRRIRALLEDGETVSMLFDWPGSTPAPFLGRPTWLASGTARLSTETGALVLPAMRRWRRGRPETVVAPPLDPRDFRDWRALHERIAAIHSHWIARRPAALEDPRRPGAWEAAATAEAWGPLPARS